MLARPLQVVETPLLSGLHWLLDDAADSGEMTLLDIGALRLYGDRETMEAIRARGDDETLGWRARVTGELSNYASTIIEVLPPGRRAAMQAAAIPHAFNRAIAMANTLGNWAFDDTRIGGDLIDFRGPGRRRVMRDGETTPKYARRLASPKFIRRYIKNNESAVMNRRTNLRLWEQVRASHGGLSEADRESYVFDLNRHQAVQDVVTNQQWNAMLNRRAGPAVGPRRVKVKPGRKIVARSAAAAADILGARAVSMLARGEMIEIPGEKFSLAVSCRSIFTGGHGALNVNVVDKDGRTLGSLCTYQDKTPALDQVASMALEMSSGCEDDLLAAANVISTTEAGAMSPILTGHHSTQPLPPLRLNIDWRYASITTMDSRGKFAAYWREHGHLWRGAAGNFIIGQKRWHRFHGMFSGLQEGELLHVH